MRTAQEIVRFSHHLCAENGKETIKCLQESSNKAVAQNDNDHDSSITTTFPKTVSF
jgi:hypothetical protein